MKKTKAGIITFKVDESLVEAMKGVPNRSEFIRSAVLHALQNVCPLCRGTGILTPNQRQHWESFAEDHRIRECEDCHEFQLVCIKKPKRSIHQKGKGEKKGGAR